MTSTETAQREVNEDKLDTAQEQLMRQMALKMLATVEEEERARRISEEAQENALKSAAYDKLISVQEDLVRTINLMQVCYYGNVVWPVGILFKLASYIAFCYYCKDATKDQILFTVLYMFTVAIIMRAGCPFHLVN